MAKPQKKPETKTAESVKLKTPKVNKPRTRDSRKTPSYRVLGSNGEPILDGQTFTKFRLARRAAQRRKNQGGRPIAIENTRNGIVQPFIPFPPKPEAPKPTDPAVAVKPAAGI
jgi:hypothetical protein